MFLDFFFFYVLLAVTFPQLSPFLQTLKRDCESCFVSSHFIFYKYLVYFSLVGKIERGATVKALDGRSKSEVFAEPTEAAVRENGISVKLPSPPPVKVEVEESNLQKEINVQKNTSLWFLPLSHMARCRTHAPTHARGGTQLGFSQCFRLRREQCCTVSAHAHTHTNLNGIFSGVFSPLFAPSQMLWGPPHGLIWVDERVSPRTGVKQHPISH